MMTLNISCAKDSPTVDTVTSNKCGGSTPTMFEMVVLMASTTCEGHNPCLMQFVSQLRVQGQICLPKRSTRVSERSHLSRCVLCKLFHDLRLNFLHIIQEETPPVFRYLQWREMQLKLVLLFA